MNRITKSQIPCTKFHEAVAHLVLQYFQEMGGSISLVSKEDWLLVNGYFVDRGITEAKLRRILDNWPGPGWIEFVLTPQGIDAVLRESK